MSSTLALCELPMELLAMIAGLLPLRSRASWRRVCTTLAGVVAGKSSWGRRELPAAAEDLLANVAAAAPVEALTWFFRTFEVSVQAPRERDYAVMRMLCARGCLRSAQWLARECAFGYGDFVALGGRARASAARAGHDEVVVWIHSSLALCNLGEED